MLDYYSEYEGPTFEDAKTVIRSRFQKCEVDKYTKRFLQNIKTNSLLENELIEDAFDSLNMFVNGKAKYSYSGWCIFGIPDIFTHLSKSITLYRLKIIRKFKGIFKTLIILNSMYKSTLEKLYKPDSYYVNNVLKTHFYQSNS